jgi:hypothetical protein
VLLIGGGLTGFIALAGAVIVAQMSGCCGGAPTHGCKFIEVSDAAMDAGADAMLTCGLNEVCIPGQTTCCLEAMSQPPLRCIPLTAVCKGQSASCGSDQDCPAGSGLHCCATVATQKIQCQSQCSGDFRDGGTIRVCRSNSECPAELPLCGTITVGGQTIYACLPMPTN